MHSRFCPQPGSAENDPLDLQVRTLRRQLKQRATGSLITKAQNEIFVPKMSNTSLHAI
jgi:hypothetical protein